MTCAELIKTCSSFDFLQGYGFKLSKNVNLNVELESSHLPTPFSVHIMTTEYFQLLLTC